MNTLKPDLAEVNKFFSLLWPSAKEGLLPIFFIGKQKKNVAKFFKIDGLNGETFSIIEKLATRSDVYHAVGLLKARPKGGSRGSEVDVIAIPGLWADVDCREGRHNVKNLPSREEALSFIKQLSLQSSLIIWSGGGLHVYWLFKEPLYFHSEKERQAVKDLSSRFQNAIIAKASQKGWKLDNTSDLCRLLRVPGTFNHKRDPVPVEILGESDLRYGLENFEKFLSEEPVQEKGSSPEATASKTSDGNLSSLPVPFPIKELIKKGTSKGSRSEAVMSVITSLIQVGADEAEIISIFESNPKGIGEKYFEKGSGREKWLQDEIQRAREWMAKKQRPKRESQAEDLINIVHKKATLRHDTYGCCYAWFKVSNGATSEHSELRDVRSPSFRGWLRSEYLKKNGKAPTKNAISDAVETIGGQAEFEGRLIKPCVRVGGFNDAVYLDLGRDGWESVRIDGSGSSLVQSGEVPFIRPGGMDALPIPAEQGDLRDLLRFINVKDESDFILITAWLIGAMMPEGPYPILALHGEQGSSKSTTAKILKSIIDPSTASFRSTPRSERDLAISLYNSRVLIYDNLSSLSDRISNALCRSSTGGGFTVRRLYTDREEEVFTETRPMIITGISDVITRHDLLDRAIVLVLPPLKKVRTERELWAEFEKARPEILGGLLRAVSEAVRNRKGTKVPELSRMADFAHSIIAAEPVLPWKPGEFMKAYKKNRDDVHHLSVESDLFMLSFVGWFKGKNEWTGTVSELGELVEEHVTEFDWNKQETLRRMKGWPCDGPRVGKKLREISGTLRKMGIIVTFNSPSSIGRSVTIRRSGGSEGDGDEGINGMKKRVGLEKS